MMEKNFASIVFLLLQVSPASPFPKPMVLDKMTECKITKNDTGTDLIGRECSYLHAIDGYFEFKIEGDPAIWDKFAENLQFVENIHFVFDGSSVAELKLKVPTFANSGLTVKNNAELTGIEINSRVTTLNVIISGNPKLANFELVGGSNGLAATEFRIENNTKLDKINMEKLKKIELSGNFSLSENLKLKTIDMAALKSFKANSLRLIGNKALEKFELPAMDKFEATNGVEISKNDHLSMINFNSQLDKSFSTSKMEIRQNKHLVEVAINKEKTKIVDIIVHGNRALSNDSLILLGDVKSTNPKDIQEFGECLFDEPIKNMEELDGCVVINSTVSFDNSATGNITNNLLTTINGDVYLAELEPGKVDFLAKVNVRGVIKSDICDFQLPPHNVTSPECTTTTIAITTTTTASTTIITTTETTTTVSTSTNEAVEAVAASSIASTGNNLLKDAEILPEPLAVSTTTEDSGMSMTTIAIIAGAIPGAIIVIVVVGVSVGCYCKRKKKKKQKSKEDKGIVLRSPMGPPIETKTNSRTSESASKTSSGSASTPENQSINEKNHSDIFQPEKRIEKSKKEISKKEVAHKKNSRQKITSAENKGKPPAQEEKKPLEKRKSKEGSKKKIKPEKSVDQKRPKIKRGSPILPSIEQPTVFETTEAPMKPAIVSD